MTATTTQGDKQLPTGGFPSKLSTIALGPLDFPEFGDAAAWLRSHTRLQRVHRVREAGNQAPDLVVLACPRRGEFTAKEVTQLKQAFPLAPVVALLGSWCAGPWRRRGDLLNGAWLVPWHQWNAWAACNLSLHRSPGCASWSLPVTSAADELANFWSHHDLPNSSGLVAIDADDRDTAEGIADAAALAGLATAWCPTASQHLFRGAVAYVCDADAMDEAVLHRVRAIRDAEPSASICVLLNFPVLEDVLAAKTAGADVVFGKPFTLHEFLGQLSGMVAQPRRVAA